MSLVVRTIGVAVGIPEPWGSQLDGHRAASGDPMASLIPAHLTLLGPTEVDAAPDASAKIEEHLAGVAADHAPFQLHLRGTGTFRPVTHVVFVAVAAGIAACEQLAADITSGPLSRTLKYPYHPHVTVAQDVPERALDAVYRRAGRHSRPAFPSTGSRLYEHVPDGRWQPQRRFILTG